MQNLPDPIYALKEITRVGKSSSQIAISVLKKALTISNFKNIIQNSGLKDVILYLNNDSKDLLAFKINKFI